ncbi:MAG: hypothetical protein M3347_03135 [Armatimonadota bacterium]|nr:hypothetical protein [Armatimonadota bacterium]
MKKCPQCGKEYPSEFTFCQNDGADLVAVATAPPGPVASLLAAPAPIGAPAPAPAESASGLKGSRPIGAIVAGVALLLGIALFVAGNESRQRAAEERRRAEDARHTAAAAEQVGASNASATMPMGSPPVAPVDSTIAHRPTQAKVTERRLTEKNVHQLVDEWADAQNRLDYPRYAALYADDFTGIKRTRSGRKSNFNLVGWLRDRHRMMKKARGLEVSLSARVVSLHGNWAEVSFEQYFRTEKYGDRGQKILKVRATLNGPRIFYEELLSSQSL